MANYKVNEKSKTISVSDGLTPAEESIVGVYVKQGYTVKLKKANNGGRVKEEDILKYFEDSEDEAGKKAYVAARDAKIKDKNDKERKGGFLVALKWFKANYAKAYEELKKKKKAK